jgi:hypothetical protein
MKVVEHCSQKHTDLYCDPCRYYDDKISEHQQSNFCRYTKVCIHDALTVANISRIMSILQAFTHAPRFSFTVDFLSNDQSKCLMHLVTQLDSFVSQSANDQSADSNNELVNQWSVQLSDIKQKYGYKS